MRKCPPLQQAGGDFKSNSAQVPQKDSRLRGGIPPQRLTFPWGTQTHEILLDIYIVTLRPHTTAHGSSQKS